MGTEGNERIMKRGISGIFGAGALAFVLPFMLVSCGGVEFARFSGVELAFGTAVEGESIGPRVELQVALALAVLASIFAWFGATGPAGGFAVVGAGALAVHAFIMGVQVQGANEDAVFMSLRYEIGFWLALVAFVLGAVLCANLEVQRARSVRRPATLQRPDDKAAS